MKVTSKGQVTIPIELRERTGIVPGSEVEFDEKNGQLLIRKVKGTGKGAALIARMTGKGNLKLSTDQIMALTRGK